MFTRARMCVCVCVCVFIFQTIRILILFSGEQVSLYYYCLSLNHGSIYASETKVGFQLLLFY